MSNAESLSRSPLVDRRQAAEILNCAAITVRRIEGDGKLTPIKLRAGGPSKTFYRRSEVLALIGEPSDV